MLVSKQEVCEEIFQDIYQQMPFFSESCFFALAAPSFEGKTQSAFVLERVKPLYFPLCKAYVSGIRASQFIYDNYSDLATALCECAKRDFSEMEAQVKKKGITLDGLNGEKITDNGLLMRFKSLPFWTLGFFKALVDHLNLKSVENPSVPWMELLADSLKFEYSPISMFDVINARSRDSDYFKDVCVFLDEFVNEDNAVLVRNLCRAVNLNCLVANTNAKVANVGVGKEKASRGRGDLVWSIVFSELSSANFSIDLRNQQMDQHPLKSLIAAILAGRQWAGEGKEEDPVAVFLNGITANLIRPGIAELLIDALSDFVEQKLPHLDPDYPVVLLADSVCRVLANLITCRKASMKREPRGQLAKLGLLCDKAFVKETVVITADDAETALEAEKRKRRLWNQRGYLADHLFYLSNPQDSNSSVFLTFASEPQNRSERSHLDVYFRTAVVNKRYPWLLELTHFKKEDVCTLLGCFFISIQSGIGKLLLDFKIGAEFHDVSMYNAPNENLESQNSGNELEVSAACIICESSRHPHMALDSFTFAGQDGINFVRNVIRNCIISVAASISGVVEAKLVEIPAQLNTFLSNCTVPFIYGWDERKMELLDKLTDLTRTDVHPFFTSNLSRCKNSEEIDAKFALRYKGQEITATAECKNYHAALHAGDLVSILKKALKQDSSKLGLIFCQSASLKTSKERRSDMAEAEADGKNELAQLCRERRVNFYRILKAPDDFHFIIVPFDDFVEHSEAALNCILFETRRISYVL